MTANAILDSALVHFARDGYDGASLRNIAEDIGIKKPSIYAHFRSKDDLFLQLMDREFKRELAETRLLIEDKQSGRSAEERLRIYIHRQCDSYIRDEKSKFIFRSSYFPPQALYEEVMSICNPFLYESERLLVRFLQDCKQRGELPNIDPEQTAIAFMVLVDGLNTELIYNGLERFQQRFEAAWQVFWKGIHH